MDYTKQVFVKLLANCICEEKIINEIDFSKIDSEELIRLSEVNTVSPLVYTSIKDFENVPSDLLEKLKLEFSRITLKMAKYDTVQARVVDELNGLGLPYAIVKGKTIAKYYPSKELRNMSDIDVLVLPKDFEEVKKSMFDFCEEKPDQVGNEFECSFVLNGITIELQNNLAYDKNLSGKYDYDKYFLDLINHRTKDGNVSVLEPKYSFIYNIYHMAQHFYYSGSGVRMITDIAVMIKYFKNTFNWDEIIDTLKEIELFEYANNIFSLIDEWFGIKIPSDSFKKKEISEELKEYILEAGVFGRANINSDVAYFRKHDGFFKWLFPPYSYMRTYSGWFKEKPAVLLPLAYVIRMGHGLRMRGGMVKGISVTGQTKKDFERHKEYVKLMGLE